jgi:hypothetical protein
MHREYSDCNKSNCGLAALVHVLLTRTNGIEQNDLDSTLGVILQFDRIYD